tara:strand:+ start:267 stop:692 length:426 start_codon:yes stop_codon:yes gene_type:complete
MNTNFSDGDYVIVKKGNKITAMGFNISKVTNKKGSIVPAGLLSQLIKKHDKDKEDVDVGDIDLLEKNVADESDENVVSDDLWENLLKLASKVEKCKEKETKIMEKQEVQKSRVKPKPKKKRRTKKKALLSGKRTTKRSKSK